jgi:TolB-like protein/tetratricopeptide (TPR) repeat protein
MKQFFDELKRRNVVRVGFAYLVVGWLVFQVGEVLFPTFGAPEWVFKSLILLITLGLPFALLFAWAFELTPQGIKKTEEVDLSESITPNTGKKLNVITIAALVVALAYFVWDRQSHDDGAEPAAAVAATEADVAEAEVEENEPEGPGELTIAVLPFVNMSSDREQEWFADGLTEEILNSLARMPDLLVTARTSSFAYKGSNRDITEIANALGVAHVLEGSVRRGGDRLRVTSQLIRAKDGFHLWSETYDRDFADLIDIQEDVAVAIASALEIAMDPEALADMVSAGTSSVPAFEAYLQGLAYGVSTVQTGDAYIFLNARDAFERAVEIDPEFAKAHWQLALFWDLQRSTTNIIAGTTEMTRDELQVLYDDAIDAAIRFEDDPVDQTFYRAHKALNQLKMRQALRLTNEYLEHRPHDQTAHYQQLDLLPFLGTDDEVIKAVRRYYDLDGHDSIVTNTSITRLTFAGDMEYLREYASRAAAQFPDEVFVHYQAHRGLLWAGDIDGAAQLLPFILSSDLPESSRYMVQLRQACADNRINDAQRLYERGQRQFSDEPSMMWLSHVIMNQQEAAIESLRELDDPDDLAGLAGFLTYGTFDPRPYPNLMALMESQRIEPGEVQVPPYQCRL